MNPRIFPFRVPGFGALALAVACMSATPTTRAALKDGLVSYWPLDEVVGSKTPDRASGYDMELANLTEADLVDGKRGKAFKFDNARQTMLRRINAPGEALPINQHASLTISFWANVNGTGLSDLRLFSEGSTTSNDPLFNLGTHNTGADGNLDVFIRRSGWTTVDHLKTEGTPLDGSWHHIVFVQQEDGSRAVYIDGVRDSLEIPAKPEGAWAVNTTTIGGILRANPTHWLTGMMDEVALWKRALTEAEITQVFNEGLVSVFPPLADGMVAYWPLDEVLGVKTPELVSGYDMELVNLTAADLVPGKRGNAFKFDNARQTMLRRINAAGERLPVNQYPALTITFWANVVGTGLLDLRLFSEGNTGNNNPLFNLGTANTGDNGTLDLFFRQSPWPEVNHLRSVGEPLDGTWHHITFVQQTDGSRALYIDGTKDAVEIPAKPEGAWNLNTTTIGGILRANPTHWLTGLMDDVALWNRALSETEIKSVYTDGPPIPFSIPQPLAIRSFTADLSAVAVGDSVTLRWDVTKSVQVTIDQGVGDVTAQTVSGLGSIAVPLTRSRTFTLTLTRGTETVSKSVAVAAIPDVADGWALIDNFDRYNVGNLNGNGEWKDLTATGFSIVDVGGNRLLAPNAGDVGAVFPLKGYTVTEGLRRTLFFRVYTQGDPAEFLRGEVVVTDRRLRFGNESNNGPGARISDEMDDLDRIGAANGFQGILELFDPPLDTATAYNVWVDINNGPTDPGVSTGDTVSIHVQKASGGTRTTIVQDYAADRDPVGQADTGFTLPDLDSLAVIGRASHSTTRNLLFDDFYISEGGFLATVPRAFGYSTPVAGEPPSLSIRRSATQLEVVFGAGTLQSADTVPGTWTDVAGATSPYAVNPTAGAKFYRVRE